MLRAAWRSVSLKGEAMAKLLRLGLLRLERVIPNSIRNFYFEHWIILVILAASWINAGMIAMCHLG